MFAIVRTGGKQYKVAPGDVFEVERLKAETASTIVLEEVLLVGDETECTVGTPIVEGAGVTCTVLSSIRGPKIRVFKYKAKKRYRRMQGHRQELTVLRVDDVRVLDKNTSPPKRAKTTSLKMDSTATTKPRSGQRAQSPPRSAAAAKSKAVSKKSSASRSKSKARTKPASQAKSK